MLNKGAIWTYWKGAYRDTGRDEGATMVLQTANKKGWFWYIPLHDDIVSVGVVAPFDYLFKGRGDHEQTYQRRSRSLRRRSRSASRTRRARPVTSQPETTRIERSKSPATAGCSSAMPSAFSIRSTRPACCWPFEVWRDGRRRHRRRTGEEGRRRAAQLGKWGAGFNEGVDRMRRLVCEYYDGFSFGNFVRHYPELHGHGDRPADRRPVHRPRRQGVGADGVAVRAGSSTHSGMAPGHGARPGRRQGE